MENTKNKKENNTMKKFTISDNQGNVMSKHNTLELANNKLRKIDAVKYSLYADDVNWLNNHEEALQGYNYSVGVI